MTFGHGPDTFPHSAAHVLNINNVPSISEGEQINEIYVSVAPPIVKYLTFNTGSNLNRGVLIKNTHPKSLFFTLTIFLAFSNLKFFVLTCLFPFGPDKKLYLKFFYGFI